MRNNHISRVFHFWAIVHIILTTHLFTVNMRIMGNDMNRILVGTFIGRIKLN